MRTEDAGYAERLHQLESAWWKKIVDVQKPYRAHLRRLDLGFVLDVGCGIGRHLINLGGNGRAIGVDHNSHAVAIACSRGVTAYTVEQFQVSQYACRGRFDSMLMSHVIEHMRPEEAVTLIKTYAEFVRSGGKVVIITPQEAGFASDATHVEFIDFRKAAQVVREAGLTVLDQYSFPLPRVFGWLFRPNEFVTLAAKVERTCIR